MRAVRIELLTLTLLIVSAQAQRGQRSSASECLSGEGVCLTPVACEQSGREVRYGHCGGARGRECCVRVAVDDSAPPVITPSQDRNSDVYFFAAIAAVSLTVVVAILALLLWACWCRRRRQMQAMQNYGSPTLGKGAPPSATLGGDSSPPSGKSARDATNAASATGADGTTVQGRMPSDESFEGGSYQVFTSQLFAKPHQQNPSQASNAEGDLPPAWKPLPGVLLRVASCAASSVNGSAVEHQAGTESPLQPRGAHLHSTPVPSSQQPAHGDIEAAHGAQDSLRRRDAAHVLNGNVAAEHEALGNSNESDPAPAPPTPDEHSHTVHNVPSEVLETMEGEDDDEFQECSFPLPAITQRSNHSRLVTALLGMATDSPPEPLAGRFVPTGELTNAGQALVAYARSASNTVDELAIKLHVGFCNKGLQRQAALFRFFLDEKAFAKEIQGYKDPFLSHFLPPLEEANDASGASVICSTGFKFPPFLVLSRGVTLSMWLQEERDAADILLMVRGVAAMLEALHAKGLVLTDLCPSNIIWLPKKQQWRFLELKGLGQAGVLCIERARASQLSIQNCQYDFMLCRQPHMRLLQLDTVYAGTKRVPLNAAYAPPEAISAQHSGQQYSATVAADIWALGVVAFEALTELTVHSTNRSMTSSSFTGSQQLNPGLCALASGARKYPWECAVGQMPERWAWCAVRPALQACVSRNALARPTATDLLHSLRGQSLSRKVSTGTSSGRAGSK